MASLDFDTEKAAFREFHVANLSTLKSALDSYEALINALLQLQPDIQISSVDGRIKEREECISKFTRKYRTSLESSKTPYTIREEISDLIGLRIVCIYEDDIEKVKNAIEAEFDVLDVTNKTALIEGTEDSFGYKGLHLDLRLNPARQTMAEYTLFAEYPFELQIRTVVQDSWSIVDHKIKYKKSIPNSLKRRINTLAALFELADREFREIRDATLKEIQQAETTYQDIQNETQTTEVGSNVVPLETAEQQPGGYTLLNAFYFLRIAQHFFPGHEFEPRKVDGFTEEVVALKPDISRGKFNYYMRDSISKVRQYQSEFEASGEKMNPFTVIRHCLYAGDKKVYKSVLTNTARNRFDTWLAAKPNTAAT